MKNIDIDYAINNFDFGCVHIDVTSGNEIFLDNDPDGNGRFGHLFLKVNKNHIKISKGYCLKKEEKLSFYYKDYNNIHDLFDDITKFSNKYFSSFIVVRKS